jgi:maltose alpha-D-glucosyltransferase/alpha-amylase
MAEDSYWKNLAIYETYVDKFAGDFRVMAEKIGYLKKLGVNCVWLLPHYSSPMVDDGYDVSDYLSVRKELGTLEDFENFTRKAHKAGIRVIVDFVLNHVSTEHVWFKEASRSPDNPKRDYFIWSKTGREFSQAVNPFSRMKPSNWIANPATKDYYFATFYPQQADLNWDNPAVFDEMAKIMDFWIRRGVDGFRLDAVPFLIKREGTACVNLPETHEVLKKIRKHVDDNHSGIFFLAEANGSLEQIKSYFGGGDECHMAFHFYLMSKMFLALKRAARSSAEEMVKESSGIPENCQWATFLRNHDDLTLTHIAEGERRELLEYYNKEGTYGFEGSQGISKRLADLFGGDENRILEAFEMLFGFPGSPVVYYGDEIGMRNLNLPERPADSRRYLRGDFDWKEAEKQAADPGSLLNKVIGIIGKRQPTLPDKR